MLRFSLYGSVAPICVLYMLQHHYFTKSCWVKNLWLATCGCLSTYKAGSFIQFFKTLGNWLYGKTTKGQWWGYIELAISQSTVSTPKTYGNRLDSTVNYICSFKLLGFGEIKMADKTSGNLDIYEDSLKWKCKGPLCPNFFSKQCCPSQLSEDVVR